MREQPEEWLLRVQDTTAVLTALRRESEANAARAFRWRLAAVGLASVLVVGVVFWWAL